MADEKDTEASRLAPEKFFPEFNRLSVEGPTNDDDDGGIQPKNNDDGAYLKFNDYCCYFDPLDEGHKEFGRDTNRLDYFRVSPFEVSYDSVYGESDYYGGGTSHTGQQESAPTINLDTSDLRPTDSNVLLQEETIPNIGLGTIENVHAENTDIGQDNDTTTDRFVQLYHLVRNICFRFLVFWLGIFDLNINQSIILVFVLVTIILPSYEPEKFMADEKDTEASRLAPEKFIPEFNRLSVEGPTNDDDDDCGRPLPPPICPLSAMPCPCGYFDPLDEGHEFGRDTNRLDYFRVSPLEVSYDSAYGESDNYGGGTSHTGQQESAPTINFDTSDLRPTDSIVPQEETIPNIGLGTIENVHAENTDIGQDNDTTTDLSNCIIWLGIFGLLFWFFG